ncbi:AIPR family protein [Priestia filamentosa]|uniref:AIPR family protein n=1 Tax=Priestia filamentosa TaxID=1402861 RepID=UPI003981CD9C
MIDYATSIEEFINLYLESKDYESTEFKEEKNFYYNEESKHLFIYDICEIDNIEKFGIFTKEQDLNKLKDIEFKNIEFLILVKSIEQKYLLRNNPKFKTKLSSVKSEIASYLVNRNARHIKDSYEFIVDPSKTKPYDINIKERYRATEANPLSNPETNGVVFTANLSNIVNLYNGIGNPLFSENLRIGLDKKDDSLEVTPEILETLRNNPEEFWFLNNGITIIAEEKTLNLDYNSTLQLRNLYNSEEKKWNISVINGAQTISAASQFFFEDYKEKDKKVLNELLNDEKKLDKFIKELINEYPESLQDSELVLKNKLKLELMKNGEKNIESFNEFIKVCLKDCEITKDSDLIVERFLQKILPNRFSIERAKKKADVLLRIIYYKSTNQMQVSEITSKVTVALNRQKPMRKEDIALASLFVQNINNYYALGLENCFSIIRRGEGQSIDFKHYSLQTVVRMLVAISNKNPGIIGSTSLADRLEETEKKDSYIILDNNIFKGIFNTESLLKDDSNQEEDKLQRLENFKKSFKRNYSFINSAIKTYYLINELLKVIKKKTTINQFETYYNSLGGNLNSEKEIEEIDFGSLKAMITYGKDYILACWFYQCWKYTLDDEENAKDFYDKMMGDEVDFSKIDYSNPIFKGEYKANENESTEEKEAKYKQLFCKFLIKLSNRWGKTSSISKDKDNKNGFKSANSHKFINEFLEKDLSSKPEFSVTTKPTDMSVELNEPVNMSIDEFLTPTGK